MYSLDMVSELVKALWLVMMKVEESLLDAVSELASA